MSRYLGSLGALLAVLVVAFAGPTIGAESSSPSPAPSHRASGRFQNLDPRYADPLHERLRRLLHQGLRGSRARGPVPVPLVNDGAALRANGTAPTLTWVGHATFLVQIDGLNILTDPHWGSYVGPFEVASARRLTLPGLRFEDLPRIDAVVVSHDHYDHLDAPTVRRLAQVHHPVFVTPLGFRGWFADLGITNVVELDWWESRSLGPVTFVCTPAQHGSGRTLADQNRRLWSSWVLVGRDRRLFFGGDSGYFDGFREIGQRWGPFDVAALPIGGYSAYETHHPNHLNPEEAVQAFEALHGRLLVPMHWGTFALNHEPFREPPDRLMAAAFRRGLEETVAVLSPGQTIHW